MSTRILFRLFLQREQISIDPVDHPRLSSTLEYDEAPVYRKNGRGNEFVLSFHYMSKAYLLSSKNGADESPPRKWRIITEAQPEMHPV